jgi:hypothetical protein
MNQYLVHSDRSFATPIDNSEYVRRANSISTGCASMHVATWLKGRAALVAGSVCSCAVLGDLGGLLGRAVTNGWKEKSD